MNKKEFVGYHAKANKLQFVEAEKEVNGVLNSLVKALGQDGSVKLTGVMSFKVNTRPAGKARNPKTGEIVDTQERKTVSFSSGKFLKDEINRDLEKANKKKVASVVAKPVAKKIIKKKKK